MKPLEIPRVAAIASRKTATKPPAVARPAPVEKAVRPRKQVTNLDQELRAAAEAKHEISPAERIRVAGRCFRISFGQLPGERKLDEATVSEMLQGHTTANREQLKLAKSLFPKHEAIKQLNSAKNRVLKLFEARTLSFPEPGARVLVVDTSQIDFAQPAEQIEKQMAVQVDTFLREIRESIGKYEEEVASLARNWDDVLSAAKTALGDLYDIRQYPTALDLPNRLYCRLTPMSTDLPREYSHIDPIERQRALAAIDAQYREVVEKQAEVAVKGIQSAIEQMLTSLRGTQSKTQRGFKNSVIENVYTALGEFKHKTLAYGILRNTEFEEQFRRLQASLKAEEREADITADLLRRSPNAMQQTIDRVADIGAAISNLVQRSVNQRRTLAVDA